MNFAKTTTTVAAMAYGEQSTLPDLPFTLHEIQQFSAGLIQGVLHTDNLPQIEKCLKDGEYTAGEMVTIFNDVKTKEIKNIIDALPHVGNIFLHFPETLIHCTHMSKDVARLAAWAAPFKNPKQELPAIWANILQSYVGMVHDLDLMNQYIAKNNIQAAGARVADILVLGLGPVKVAEDDIDALPVTQW